MSPEDQIAAIAEVRANYAHIMDALRDLKGRMEVLPTHADLKAYATQAELNALREQVESLKRGSPSKLFDMAVKVALGILALAGLWALVEKAIVK